MNVGRYLISFVLAIFFSISINASSPLKTKWMPLLLDGGITSVMPFQLLAETPILTTTPTTTRANSVSVEVNGSPGLKVFVNGRYVGKIKANGKLGVSLNTSGRVGLKRFFIFFEDIDGYRSETLSLQIQKGIDTVPPAVTMVSPGPGAIVTDRLTPLVFTIDDINGSGLDITEVPSITFTNANKTYLLEYDANNDQYTYTPSESTKFSLGDVSFVVSAKDYFDNQTHQTFSIFIKEQTILTAVPLASPKTAYAPATIRFSPQVTTDNAIQRYYWDFNGDGSYERNDITANSYTWQYTEPGDYNVTLKVVDVNNEMIIGSTIVHILNIPPQIAVESSPSNGAIPLTVNFSVTATDTDGIALYEWDFNGDGFYDYNSTASGNTSYTYTSEGIYNAKLRVTDSRGASTIYTTPTTKVLASSEGSPSVTASASPLTGNAPLSVTFSATANDPQNKGFVLYEWDYDGDGIYDYNSTTSANTNFTYVEAGVFYPRIKVTTTDGRITYDALEVIANQSVSLSVVTDTIDILQSETTTIRTVTTARSQIKIMMEDRDYNIIKVVQDWTIREAGSYDDAWDGTDANNNPVKEGDYYAVLLYKVGNEIKRLDLRDSSGGTRYNPPRTENPRSFAPYDNRPMKIDFTLSRPSEVVSFIGYDYTDTRIVTLRSREVLGKGTYTDSWNSINDEGAYILPPPGRWFLYGVWAFTLADNVVYVKSGAHVSAIRATPPIYTPDSHEEGGEQATMKIHFTLNKPATIEMEVFDATEGVPVATRTFTNVPAGDQIVEFDGKDNNGVYLHPGKYSVGIRAVDENGYRSMMEYTITRIHY
jgi:PKD repeat protein/flagellar hook assembly protein FlgD